jgi:hypothetical protein
MHVFQDSTGREWPIEINAACLKRVWDTARVDLGVPEQPAPGDTDTPLITRLRFGSALLCSILPAVCLPQIAARGMTADRFLEALGDAIPAARDAFYAEWKDFFQRTGDSERSDMFPGMEAAVEENRKIRARDSKAPEKPTHGACPQASPAAIGSPESSESTPADSPSAS